MRRLVADAGLEGVIEVDSAGTYGGHAGELPDARMRRAAVKRGYDLRHRSRRIAEEDFAAFDCIVAMDDTNYEALCRMAPSREAIGKVCRMAEFFGPAYADRTYVPVPPADLPVSTDSIMLSAPEYGVAFHRVLCGESGQNFAHC